MTMNAEQIHGNLVDAGCDATLIEQFETMQETAQKKDRLRLLNAYRRQLLDTIHAEQKRLDCLDYLIYALNSQSTARGCDAP